MALTTSIVVTSPRCYTINDKGEIVRGEKECPCECEKNDYCGEPRIDFSKLKCRVCGCRIDFKVPNYIKEAIEAAERARKEKK